MASGSQCHPAPATITTHSSLHDFGVGTDVTHFKQLRGQVQSRTRELKNTWWADKATEVQNHADNKQSKEFYAGLKSIFGPVQCTMAPIRNRDGMLLTDKEDILKQWTLHFSTLLNLTSEVTDEALESIQQRPMIPELDAPPNAAETDAVIKQLQTGKAPGPDGIPAEVFKAGGETLITHLTQDVPSVLGQWSAPTGVQGCQHHPLVQKTRVITHHAITTTGSASSALQARYWPVSC